METCEFINDVVEKVAESLEAYRKEYPTTENQICTNVVRGILRMMLGNKLKDCKIISIPDLKENLAVKKDYNPVTDSYEFRTSLTTIRKVSRKNYDDVTDPQQKLEFKKMIEDSVKDSFIYFLDKD